MSAGKVLPFFVKPFRGECYYSILSRYHESSAHFTNRFTATELFGRFLHLDATLILPIQILCADEWLPPESPVNSVRLMKEHTAWPYFNMSGRYGKNPFAPIVSAKTRPGRRRQTQMCREIQHPSFRLRYCPVCALDDFKREHVPYWHLIAQLKGAILCPVHGIPYLDSDFSIRSHPRQFVTAGSVLNEELLLAQSKADEAPDLSPITIEWLIRLSRFIEWMLEHGYEFDSPDTLISVYNNVLIKRNISQQALVKLLKDYSEGILLVLNGDKETEEFFNLVANRDMTLFSPLHHAILTSILFEAPEHLENYMTYI